MKLIQLLLPSTLFLAIWPRLESHDHHTVSLDAEAGRSLGWDHRGVYQPELRYLSIADGRKSDDDSQSTGASSSTTSHGVNPYALSAQAVAGAATDPPETSSPSTVHHHTRRHHGSSSPSRAPSPHPSIDPTPYRRLNVTNVTVADSGTRTFPKEQDPPHGWPMIVFCLFAVLAIALCVATGIRNALAIRSRRQNYQEISNLIV